jgi:hypothetical protein
LRKGQIQRASAEWAQTILPSADVDARNCSTYFVADNLRAMPTDASVLL